MITRIVVPQAFENMEEATIGAWLKNEGDAVAAGEPLCELITEKTTFDLPSEGAGVLRRIVAPEKSVVPVGFVIALLGEDGDEVPDVTAENAALVENKKQAPDASSESLQVSPVAAAPPQTPPAPAAGTRVRATPAARRAARERGVELEAVAAALPGKVLSEDDVLRFAGEKS